MSDSRPIEEAVVEKEEERLKKGTTLRASILYLFER